MNANNPKTLVVGVGNDFRGDDAAGLVVVRRLKEIAPDECITIMESNGDGSALLESWKDRDRVIIIDAVKPQGRPGTVCRFNLGDTLLNSSELSNVSPKLLCSTHAFGIAEAIELGRAMNKMPSRMVVYGIEGGNFNAGEGLSPEVEKAITEVINAVTKEVHLCLR